MATPKKAVQFEITERAKLAARTKVLGVKKGEFRKGWDAVTPDIVQWVQESDAECIASYTEQLKNGIL